VSQYAYTAFISYRHKLPDEAIAKKLHSLIESYSIPKDVKASSGRRKMGRVFRDQEELPQYIFLCVLFSIQARVAESVATIQKE
jgi:hypothetical protein